MTYNKRALTEKEKAFIRENYLYLNDSQMVKALYSCLNVEVNEYRIKTFREAENLYQNKERKEKDNQNNDVYFNVDTKSTYGFLIGGNNN